MPQRHAMRWFPALLASCLLGSVLSAGEVNFARVWPEWRNADAFDRIREYFGGRENDGREIVVRTHADERAGMYFVVRVNSATPLPAAKFTLEVIRPDSPDVRSFTFPVSLPGKSQLVELGMTAGDWPGGRKTHPVAWKLTLLDQAGQVVASQQSFLWQMPAQ
jgi:hypothetical protein